MADFQSAGLDHSPTTNIRFAGAPHFIMFPTLRESPVHNQPPWIMGAEPGHQNLVIGDAQEANASRCPRSAPAIRRARGERVAVPVDMDFEPVSTRKLWLGGFERNEHWSRPRVEGRGVEIVLAVAPNDVLDGIFTLRQRFVGAWDTLRLQLKFLIARQS
jgi:hypothetical protein